MKCHRKNCDRLANPLLSEKHAPQFKYCIRCARNINEMCGEQVIPWPTPEEIWAYKELKNELAPKE